MRTRKNKMKKFWIYLFPNLCTIATVIYFFTLLFKSFFSEDISWTLASIFVLIVGIAINWSLYVLFFAVGIKFWSKKEQLAYKRLKKILEIREYKEQLAYERLEKISKIRKYKNSEEYKEKIRFKNKFNEKFENNSYYELCYQVFSEETDNERYSDKEYYLRELTGKETPEEIVTKIRDRKSMENKNSNNNNSDDILKYGIGFLLGRWLK